MWGLDQCGSSGCGENCQILGILLGKTNMSFLMVYKWRYEIKREMKGDPLVLGPSYDQLEELVKSVTASVSPVWGIRSRVQHI